MPKGWQQISDLLWTRPVLEEVLTAEGAENAEMKGEKERGVLCLKRGAYPVDITLAAGKASRKGTKGTKEPKINAEVFWEK